MRDGDRTFYEIIRKESPCRLYFDLEFDKILNPNADPVRTMTLFRKILLEHIKILLGIDIVSYYSETNRRNLFVELDATSNSKFSKHVILVLPGETFFRNNIQMGEFVSVLITRLSQAEQALRSSDVNSEYSNVAGIFFFRKRDTDGRIYTKPFVDMSVYSENQQFRLVYSAKFAERGQRHFQYILPNNTVMPMNNVTIDRFCGTLAT